MNTITNATSHLGTRARHALAMSPHFWSTQHEDTRIVLGGLCELVDAPHTVKTRHQYASDLSRLVTYVMADVRDSDQPTPYTTKIVELLRDGRSTINPEDAKADNAMRVWWSLHKIEKILADDIDACTCVTAPGCLCFGTYHIN